MLVNANKNEGEREREGGRERIRNRKGKIKKERKRNQQTLYYARILLAFNFNSIFHVRCECVKKEMV